MNVAVHPQPSAFGAFSSYVNQKRPRIVCQPFAKSPHLAHSKARFNEFGPSYLLSMRSGLFGAFNFARSSVFNHIQALFQKMGGWGTPFWTLLATFAGRVAAEYYFSRVANRQIGSKMLRGRKGEWGMSLVSFVDTPKFAEYKERFKEHYKLTRRPDGVILAEAHTLGGSTQLSVENHRSVGQLFKTIGADPENEVMIFSGTGEDFMMQADPEGFKLEQEDLQNWAYEYAYKDGRINVSSLVNDLEIPTIGVLNGPGFHTEICLMCDITICSEDAIIFDLHYDIGSVPGDGIHSCFLELLGVKRGAYALLTGQAIDAKTALEYGLVNEVVPREKLLDRAWKLADHIMTQPRITRRITTQIVRRPWKKRITDDLDGGFGMQMFAHLAKKKSIHSRKHIDESVAYVKQGKRNNFE
jgi:enoyl-CoA hydratase/carnithine racemase